MTVHLGTSANKSNCSEKKHRTTAFLTWRKQPDLVIWQGRYEESIRYYVRALGMNPKADNVWDYLKISLRYIFFGWKLKFGFVPRVFSCLSSAIIMLTNSMFGTTAAAQLGGIWWKLVSAENLSRCKKSTPCKLRRSFNTYSFTATWILEYGSWRGMWTISPTLLFLFSNCQERS